MERATLRTCTKRVERPLRDSSAREEQSSGRDLHTSKGWAGELSGGQAACATAAQQDGLAGRMCSGIGACQQSAVWQRSCRPPHMLQARPYCAATLRHRPAPPSDRPRHRHSAQPTSAARKPKPKPMSRAGVASRTSQWLSREPTEASSQALGTGAPLIARPNPAPGRRGHAETLRTMWPCTSGASCMGAGRWAGGG